MKSAMLIIDVQQGLCEGEGQACLPVVFIQHESGPGYLAHGTPAWKLANGLKTEQGDRFVRKTTPDSFLRTELRELLQAQGVTELIICGMHTEFCVDTTTRRALALGYPVVLVEDGHTSAGNAVLTAPQVIAHHNATLTNISSFGPRVRTIPAASFQPHNQRIQNSI